MTRVLIIDDDWEIRELLVEILSTEGFECSSAANGRDGLRLALSESPKLILLDMMMPAMSGREVIAELKTHASLASVPLIAMSAAEWQLKLVEEDSPGYLRTLRKPFDLHQLLALVDLMLR